jgi:hypothetical protein
VLLLFVAVCLGGDIALLSDKLSSLVSSLLGWLEGWHTSHYWATKSGFMSNKMVMYQLACHLILCHKKKKKEEEEEEEAKQQQQ